MLAIWSKSDFRPGVSDESAYLLQAEIFASGAWTLPSRPMPEFFEQEHIFVTPFVASKYPPGHSLLLTPAIWLHWPPLVPLLLIGIAGALTFALSRELSSGPVALVAWAIWLATPLNLRFLPTYFSENTTSVLWLLGWFALLKRSRGGGTGWLCLAGACIAYCGLTRPLTAIAYGLPTCIVALRIEWTARRFRPMAYGLATAFVVLLLIPFSNYKITGSASTVPIALYSRVYTPWEFPGFTFRDAAPLRALPRVLENDMRQFEELHRAHTVRNLPSILAARLAGLRKFIWPGVRIVFLILMIAGLWFGGREIRFASVTCVALIIVYLVEPHPPDWDLYYLEIVPVTAFLASLGLSKLSTTMLSSRPQRAEQFLLAVTTVVVLRVALDARLLPHSQDFFATAIAAIPTTSNLVFVRYPATDRPFLAVRNPAFLEDAKTIIVYDRGEENVQLARIFPQRAAYLMDFQTLEATPLDTAGPNAGR